MRLRWLLVSTLVVAACGSAPAEPFELRVGPEFVQGMIPGVECPLLVTIESDSDDPVTIAAMAEGATVAVDPVRLTPGEVGEVRLVAGPVSEEALVRVVVAAARDGLSQEVTKETVALPWTDTVSGEARDLFGVFATWLEANRPELGITAGTWWEGAPVAPQLLVVSHYLFESADYEAGLSWHIMIPPDDWAEVYLRPRDEPAPTVAFRLSSRAAAESGTVEIVEIPPPLEVVR
jgi:hypothetical protein